MIDVDASIEPPSLDAPGEEEGPPGVFLAVWLTEADETQRNGSTRLPGEPDDDAIADALVGCLRAVATLRGPGLMAAVARRLR